MNRRELLRDVGIATAAASLVSSAQAQAPGAGVNVLIAYYSVTGNTEKMASRLYPGPT
jgi:NAD(P)H dehydrogenase (quinone)